MKKLFKNKQFIILIASVLGLSLLIASVFTLSERRDESNESVQGASTLKPLEFEHKNTIEVFNSNFVIPINKIDNDSSEVKAASTDNDKDSETTITAEVPASSIPTMDANTLVIPRLNVRTSVIEGIDGEKAIHEGAWLYPNSYEGDGEKILLGHRRFWGADDPRSFWNLDQLQGGDKIFYSDSKGTVYSYAVKSVAVRNAGDLSTLKPSKENIIKVISCSTADGSAGSSEKRIVVIATQI